MMRYFNGVNQDAFTSSLIFVVGVSYVVAMYAFVTAKNGMSIPQFVILGSTIGQVPLCITFGYGIFGAIYDVSIKALQAFRTTNDQ